MPRKPHAQLPPPLEALVLAATSARRLVGTQVVQSLWSGYGQIFRCQLEGGSRASVVVKHVRWPTRQDHPRGWNSDHSHRRKVRSYEVETAWYQNYSGRCPATSRVPECLMVQTRGNEVFLVLEDLDLAGLTGRRSRASDREVLACLSWLAHFHATFLGQEPAALWPVGTYWHLATRPEEHAVLGDSELGRAAAAIDTRLTGSAFTTLVHGDAKLANFCFEPGGERVAAVDFQYVGGGCGMKDVAYFVSSCFDEGECERREAEVLTHYFQVLERALRDQGTSIDFAALESDWRALYAVAWTDFYRFLQGWSPGHWKIHRYSERLAREVLAAL